MNAKALLIPIAAFAVTITSAQAFSGARLQEAGLSEEQVAAFETAHELRKEGDREAARDVLIEAGVDMETMKMVRQAMREHKLAQREAVQEAVLNEDFTAFTAAVADSPLADIVTTEADFMQFIEAYSLRSAGEYGAARSILEELGLEKPMKKFKSSELRDRRSSVAE